MRLHVAWAELVKPITVTGRLIGLVRPGAHDELLGDVLEEVSVLENASYFPGVVLFNISAFLVNSMVWRERLLLNKSLEYKLFASIGKGVTRDHLVVVAAQGLRLVNMLVAAEVQPLLDSCVLLFFRCLLFLLDQEDLLGLEISESYW